jgi:gliding motility-associatede transport system auxiliary component
MRRLVRLIARLYGSPRARALTGLFCLALLVVAANILAARFLPQRFDLTEDRLYTLSSATLGTLARIDEPITLRFYYSRRLGEEAPSYRRYAQRVRELLDQYVAAAHGKLRLEMYNPQPFSAVEDRAVAFGLQAVPLDAQGEEVYFGLAGTNATDDLQVIRFFSPARERLLEYDLTRLIHNLVFPRRTVVGVISTLPLLGNVQPAPILQQLDQLDKLVPLPTTLAAIPAGTDVLLVVHPHKLPPQTLFAIDQFVLRGGKAIVFVDPYSGLAVRAGLAGAATASDLPRLFKAWGLRLLPDAVAADRSAARRVLVPAGAGGRTPMDYVAWLNLQGRELNRQDPITAQLHHITVASAGILEPRPGAATHFEPLVTTSRDAMTIAADKVAGVPDVAALLTGFKPQGRRYVIAARVTGPAVTAFPDGLPGAAGKPGGSEPPAGVSLRRSLHPINLVVVADTDMLDTRFWARIEDFFGRHLVVPLADNGDFVANAIDVLAGGQDLVGLRSRGTSARPFDVVRRLQHQADRRYAAEQQALERKLKAAEAKLRDLTSGATAAAKAPLAPAEARAVDQFRAEALATRRQLRAVQRALRHNIERLKLILEFADIALMPMLVAAAALALAAVRAGRWRRRRSLPV